jgi:phosphoadenosine phosphosulfate reductase
MDLQALNEKLSKATPQEIISYALSIAKKPIITTNFSPFSASILHAVVTQKPEIDVVWVDTGYNTPQTYKYAVNLIERLQLNIHSYVPKQSVAHRNVVLGIPNVDDPKHAEFTQQVKLEPFKRAMDIHQPDIWFTNLRKGQTAFRDSIDVLSYSKDGVLKVSPFYYYSDEEVQAYLNAYDLPNETRYFDPTKQLANRECGLHV